MKKLSAKEHQAAYAQQTAKLTPKLLAQLDAFMARKKPIDYSDIPPTTDEDWKDATRGALYRPIKQQITVRVDADVIAWLRQQGSGYQSRMNSILREAMLKSA